MSLKSRMATATGEELDALADLAADPHSIECLDDGFVRLVDSMGDDAAIAQAARVSYGKGTKSVSSDIALIRYLMRHRHSTPFEMVELKFHVRVPMDCWRQWIRHRTASVNEYSTRYSEAIDSQQETPPTFWRLQSTANKQGSGGFVTAFPAGIETVESCGEIVSIDGGLTAGEYLSEHEKEFHAAARELYDERLEFGVAREQARKDLPLSTYTEAYWKIDLHNLFHFLGLRMDSHAQLEIRTYANAIFTLASLVAPYACQAFRDYRLDGMTLSGPEIAWIAGTDGSELSEREKKELNAKLARLKLPLRHP